MHQITDLWFSNYRSCKDLSLSLDSFTPLVGYNNAGKSNIIKGLIWLISPSGAITLDDFFINNDGNPIEAGCVIEGITEDLLGELGENHRGRITDYISDDGKLAIKRVQNRPGGTKSDRPLYIKKIQESLDSEEVWEKNPTGIDAAIKALFPSIIHIEAMQNASEDAAKYSSNSTLGKLLKEVLGVVEEKHGESISKAIDSLRDLLSADGAERAPELLQIDDSTNSALSGLFPGIEIRTEVPPPTMQALFKSGTLKVRGGIRGDTWHDFESMGHGAQRTIQMALVQCMAEKNMGLESVGCKVLLIDEPELYLHPQAIEQVRAALKRLSRAGFQVIFSTHSPSLIAPEDVPNTLHIRIDDNGTKVLPTIKEAVSQRIEDSRAQAETLFTLSNASQILFSEKVLIVEGKTEKRLLPHLYEKITGKTLGLDRIAVVPLNGGAGTLKALEILRHMGIPCGAVNDLDSVFTTSISMLCTPIVDQLESCYNYFNILDEKGEITLSENGLPKRDKDTVSPADAYAACAVSTECKERVAAIHTHLVQNHNIWVWPVGDIERVLTIGGKNESAWCNYLADVEDQGIDNCLKHPTIFNNFIDWLKSDLVI